MFCSHFLTTSGNYYLFLRYCIVVLLWHILFLYKKNYFFILNKSNICHHHNLAQSRQPLIFSAEVRPVFHNSCFVSFGISISHCYWFRRLFLKLFHTSLDPVSRTEYVGITTYVLLSLCFRWAFDLSSPPTDILI